MASLPIPEWALEYVDLTDAERAAILRKFAACIPWLQERARADAKRAHERLQADASARAVPTSRLTH
jgi:hypothetical protein